MTKTLSEAYSPDVLNEGLITFNMRDLAEYVTHTDKRIKNICESLEVHLAEDYSNVLIDRKNELMNIKDGNNTLKLFLKKSLLENMDNYFRIF